MMDKSREPGCRCCPGEATITARQRKFSSSRQRSKMHRGRLTTATTMMIMRPNPISRRLLLFGACILFLESHSSGSSSLSPFETQASFNPDDSRLLVKPQVENMHKHKHPPHHQLHPHPHHLQHLKNKNNINQRQNSVGNNESLALLYQDYLGRKQQHLFNSIIINNNNIDKPRKTAPQVPERLPIVVSSSDNSYVSASPIIVEATQSSPPPTTTQSTTTPVVDYRNVNYQQQQRHRPHSRTTSQRNHNHHPSQSRQLSTTNDLSARDERRPRWSLRRLWFLPPQARTPTSNQVDKIQTSSTSDISTTATTTQRNNRPEMIGPERWHQVNFPPKSESLISRFKIKLATIINTQESTEAGATFINYTVVTNFDACLVECWITDSCDTAIYQESTTTASSSSAGSNDSDERQQQTRQHHEHHLHSKRTGKDIIGQQLNSLDSSNSIYHICFLFECVKSHEFRCRFSAHDHYVSSILMKKVTAAAVEAEVAHSRGVEDVEGENSRADEESSDKSDDDDVGVPLEDKEEGEQEDFVSRECDRELKFKCSLQEDRKDSTKGGCIEMGQRCDGVADCSDGSDESDCPTQKEFRSVVDDHSSSSSDDVPSSLSDTQAYSLIDSQDRGKKTSYRLEQVIEQPRSSEMHFSRIISGTHGLHPLNGQGHGHRSWHDTHIASIQISEYEGYGRGSLNSALIATLFGVAITAMLIMFVGHKMRSIRKRLAYKNRRRSLVPDKEFFINSLTTMPT